MPITPCFEQNLELEKKIGFGAQLEELIIEANNELELVEVSVWRTL